MFLIRKGIDIVKKKRAHVTVPILILYTIFFILV